MKRVSLLLMFVFLSFFVSLGGVVFGAAKWPEPLVEQANTTQSQATTPGWREKHLENDIAFRMKMDEMTKSCQNWSALTQDEKAMAVYLIIEMYKAQQNCAVLNSPEFYAQKIDENIARDPGMATLPLQLVIRILAVMEYDFYNGQDKEALALQTLGQDLYERNKTRREQEGLI